ncbi:SafA/ExsA family spore coat assembly protein [Bacillus alkalisoli]|uniref:SafA/ExsA family spore coat assembly protein n=1 Tax=Bacillus alkalisoli TaxID=2011008 RepID=UPI000C23DC77|nr:SafA/ExsA family spore coat assembly protein [Bacillus alkalisoli]
MKIHIVQKGDTLWKIAQKYNVNFEALKSANSQLSNPDMIMPGMKIKVPTASVQVKQETQVKGVAKEAQVAGVQKEAPVVMGVQKEAPIVKEHPFKEMPKKPEVMGVKEVKEEAKAPFVPKLPQIKPYFPEVDVNNYVTFNIPITQQKANVQFPKMPPKAQPKQVAPKAVAPKAVAPKQVAPKAVASEKTPMKEPVVKGVQEAPTQHMKMPEQMPTMQMPLQHMKMPEQMPTMQMPLQHMQMPAQQMPMGMPQWPMPHPYCIPVPCTPVMPGSGLHGQMGYQPMQPYYGQPTPYGMQGMMPQAGMPQMMPEMMESDDDFDAAMMMPHMQQVQQMPQMQQFPQMPPYMGMNDMDMDMDVDFDQTQVAGLDEEQDYMTMLQQMQQQMEQQQNMGMGMPQMPMAPGVPFGQMPQQGFGMNGGMQQMPGARQGDCGCGPTPMPYGIPQQMPQVPFGLSPHGYGMPMQAGYPMGAPFNPQGYGYGYPQDMRSTNDFNGPDREDDNE